MIEADELTKEYGGHSVVDGIDLSVSKGDVYGFLGPNGAGKTTTIEMLTTLTTPSSGTATVAGHPITDRDRIKPQIGYLPAEPPVYDAFSAREQLEYVATLRGLDDHRATDRADSLLSRVGLTDAADRAIGTYSTGMRQKVGLAQAVFHEPPVVFLDEPTTGLDPRAAREVVDLIADLSADGTTVFLSTHILPVVDELADTIGVLHEGTLVAEAPPSELKQRVTDDGERTLEQAFLDVTDDDSHLVTNERDATSSVGDRR